MGYLLAGILFVISLVANLFTLGSSIYGTDSGDLVTASYFLGVPHPSGYPLYTLLGWFFSHLLFSPSSAWGMGLYSALFQSAAISVFFLVVFRWVKNYFAAFTASLVLVFSYTFWLYGHVAEVFPMNNFFVVLFLFFLSIWREKVLARRENSFRWFLLTIFIFGLGISHHQTFLLLLPAFFYFIFITQRSIFKKPSAVFLALIIFLLGFLPYIYVPIAASFNPPINWDNAYTLQGFIQLISRKDYGTFLPMKSLLGSSSDRLLQFVWFPGFLLSDFTVVGIFLAVIGVLYLFFKKRQLFNFFFLAWFFSGPLFLFYASFPPQSSFLLGVIERFLMLPAIFLALFLAFGIFYLASFFANFLLKIKILNQKEGSVRLGANLIFLILPLAMITINAPKIDLKNNVLGDSLAHDILVTAQNGSIIFLNDDTVSFNTQYYYYTKRFRNDLEIIAGGSGSQALANYAQRAVYIYLPNPPAPEGYQWLQFGLLQRLYKNEDLPSASKYRDENLKIFESYQFKPNQQTKVYRQLIFDHIFDIYKWSYYSVGNKFLELGMFDEAENFYKGSLLIDNNFSQAFLRLGILKGKIKKCGEAEKDLLVALKIKPDDLEILKNLEIVYRECIKDEKKADEYKEKQEQVKEKLEGEKLKEF